MVSRHKKAPAYHRGLCYLIAMKKLARWLPHRRALIEGGTSRDHGGWGTLRVGGIGSRSVKVTGRGQKAWLPSRLRGPTHGRWLLLWERGTYPGTLDGHGRNIGVQRLVRLDTTRYSVVGFLNIQFPIRPPTVLLLCGGNTHKFR